MRGVGCFRITPARSSRATGFRPLAGCGLFRAAKCLLRWGARFPSPCGVWVVSEEQSNDSKACAFPSPCGVWVVSTIESIESAAKPFPSPCGVWVVSTKMNRYYIVRGFPSPCGVWVVSSGCKLRHGLSGVSVPLRGVGCFCCAVVCDSQSLLFPSPCGVWVVSKFRDAVQPV